MKVNSALINRVKRANKHRREIDNHITGLQLSRLINNISLNESSNDVGIDSNIISEAEKGYDVLSKPQLIKLSDRLTIPVDSLLKRKYRNRFTVGNVREHTSLLKQYYNEHHIPFGIEIVSKTF